MPADAAPAWLWLPELPSPGEVIALAGEDAHYVARVCRAQPGDTLTATDGRGSIAVLTVRSARGEVSVGVESVRRPPDRGAGVIACGAPEGQRADWLVEKLAELGVRAFQPLDTRRGAWERFSERRDRLERLAVAALRQSCQPWKLELRDPVSLSTWLEGLPVAGERWVADPDGEAPEHLGRAGRDCLGLVGPAGGFDAGEKAAAAAAGFRPVRLSPGRLRTETAAMAWASLWACGVRADPGTKP